MKEFSSIEKVISSKKGVIFDFDGILGDTEGLHKESWDIVVAPFGVTISLDEYVQYYCGWSSSSVGPDGIPYRLKERYPQLPLSEEELIDQKAVVLAELFRTRKIELMPGVLEVLEWFKSRGFQMAVCSAKDPEELQLKLERAKLEKWFPRNCRSTQSEAGGLAKPNPVMYALAVEKLGLKPAECLAFEDTQAGVESAVGAGLYTVAMPNMYTKRQDLYRAHKIIQGGWPAFLALIHN